MSLEIIDGFDSYTLASEGTTRWDTGQATSANGRYGGNVIATSITKTLPNAVTRTCGAAFKTGTSFTAGNWIVLRDSATIQVAIKINATGTISILRGGTSLNTSTDFLSVSTWYYIELQATIDPTTGYIEVRINGKTWLTFTGNTRNTTNSFSNVFVLGVPANGGFIDDAYCRNDSTFMGELSIQSDLPNAEGDTIQWTPNASTIHWNRLSEANYDSDTTYNSNATIGNIDLYKFPNRTIAAGSSISAVCIHCIERTDTTGTVAEQCKSGGTVFTGATKTMTTSYTGYDEFHETDPATSAAWTNANLNLAQFGVKVIS